MVSWAVLRVRGAEVDRAAAPYGQSSPACAAPVCPSEPADRPHAAGQLLPLVYEELRKLAARKLAHEKPGQTLQPTALVHEAYLRLVGTEDPGWTGRGHFSGAAAEAMRRILVESAWRKASRKHGEGLNRVDLDQIEIDDAGRSDDLLALDDAL